MMTSEDNFRGGLSGCPDGDPRIFARGDRSAIVKQRHGIDCCIMKPQHLGGDAVAQIPQNSAGIETARQGRDAVL
jgi:hypothetical protein